MLNLRTFPLHDALLVRKDPKLNRFLAKDEKVLFSDFVTKINKRDVPQQRILIITDQALYNIWPYDNLFTGFAHLLSGRWALRRKISIGMISEITITDYPLSNQLVIHVDSEYDYRYDGAGNRDIIIQAIFTAHSAVTDSPLCLYIKMIKDLGLYQTTDDDMKKHCDKRPKIGRVIVTPELMDRGVSYIVKHKSTLMDKQYEAPKPSSGEIVDGKFYDREMAVEKMFNRQHTINSLSDIPMTMSSVVPSVGEIRQDVTHG